MKEKALYWLSVLFFATLFLPPTMPVINNIFIAGLVALCLVYNSPAEKWHLLKARPAVACMLLFFLLEIISAASSADQARGWAILAKRASLLLFPLSLGLIVIRQECRQKILFAYGLIIVIAAGCCLVDAIHRTWARQDSQWLYDDSLTMLIGRTSVYMALLVVLAIFCMASLLESRFFPGRSRWGAYAGIIFLLVFHYLLASRISMAFLYLTIIGYVLYQIRRNARPGRKIAILGAAVALVAASLFIFPKTLNRFRQLEYTSFDFHSRAIESHYNMTVTPDQWNGANFRLAVWSCGLAVARQHLLTGVPLGDKQAALMSEYKARDFMFAYDRHRNTHSTWLDVLINVGVAGLIIFLLAYLVFPFVAAVRSKDWLSALIISVFASAMITETWIDGSFGTILLAFWASFVSASGSGRVGLSKGKGGAGRSLCVVPQV